MCRTVHVRLAPEEAKAVRKMYGVMVPVFASIVLLVAATLVATHRPRPDAVLTADAATQPMSSVGR